MSREALAWVASRSGPWLGGGQDLVGGQRTVSCRGASDHAAPEGGTWEGFSAGVCAPSARETRSWLTVHSQALRAVVAASNPMKACPLQNSSWPDRWFARPSPS